MAIEHPLDRFGTVPEFIVTSADITSEQPLAAAFRDPEMNGSATSPQLAWSGFPPETKSFAVTVYDPDAPTGAGFWHWAVFDIPVEVTELERGAGDPSSASLPEAATILPNDMRVPAFAGAAPPPGTGRHRYFFTVHALDVDSLGLDPESTPTVLGFNAHFHTLARGFIMATSAAED